MPKSNTPKDGIPWLSYEATVALLREAPRPVLAFVLDQDGARWPFLREIFAAMPKSPKLRTLLDGPCAAMLLKADSLPEYLATLGAGCSYHIAVLSPAGLTQMACFDYVTGDPEALVEEIASALAAVAPIWA